MNVAKPGFVVAAVLALSAVGIAVSAAIRKAMRLNPRHPFYYVWIMGQSYFFMGRTEQAAAQFEKVVESNPQFPAGHLGLAAAYGVLDRVEEAEWERRRC